MYVVIMLYISKNSHGLFRHSSKSSLSVLSAYGPQWATAFKSTLSPDSTGLCRRSRSATSSFKVDAFKDSVLREYISQQCVCRQPSNNLHLSEQVSAE